MRKASWQEYVLRPKFPLGTSRGPIDERTVWFLKVWDDERPEVFGIGECAPLPQLSPEYPATVRTALIDLCADPTTWQNEVPTELAKTPSVRFAVEAALRDLMMGGRRHLFPSGFTLGKDHIPINGLVWMGDRQAMLQRINDQLDAGITCLKMKIGAINWEDELELLRHIRREHPPSELELRVDANGAFSLTSGNAAPAVLKVLQELAHLDVHSIEQPIAAGRYELMAELCALSPIPIALDEDLIEAQFLDAKKTLLDTVRPQYIVLKPSLVGGFAGAQEWIDLANERNIGWWITSALESNIGLNAIAQWTYSLSSSMTQGLGTGNLFQNNVPSPLIAEGGKLRHQPEVRWSLEALAT